MFIDYENQPLKPQVNQTIYGYGDDPELFTLNEHHRIDRSQTSKNFIELNQEYSKLNRSKELNKIVSGFYKELDDGFKQVYIDTKRMNCELSEYARQRYQSYFLNQEGILHQKHRIMICLNLHASQKVLPTISQTILELIQFLGPRSILVSIYENGSWDHTIEGLRNLEIILTKLGVEHVFRSDQRDTEWSKVDRISQLAHYRNQALLNGLYRSEQLQMNITDVVFINDVYICAQDVLELLYQRSIQNASAACGTDWRSTTSFLDQLELRTHKSVVFYDSWVSRSISGQTIRPRLDMLAEWRNGYRVLFERESGTQGDLIRRRFRNSLPVPVYSCWNGVIALDARPFQMNSSSSGDQVTLKPVRSLNLKGRIDIPRDPLVKFRSANRKKKECSSSECQLLAKDFWSLGFQRWILIPRVAVTYEEGMYHDQLIEDGTKRNFSDQNLHKFDKGIENELIDWKTFKMPEKVVCWPDMSRTHLDFEWNQVLESPLNPDLIDSSVHVHDL